MFSQTSSSQVRGTISRIPGLQQAEFIGGFRLSYLHRFPIDILKIDKSFVDRIGTSTEDEEVVSTILQLGGNLRMTTVAEGIEDYQQALALRRLGCGLAQGYYYARPIPADEIHRLLVCIDMPEMTGAP